MLKTKHFFPFIKMVKTLDIKNELKEIYQKTKGKSQDELANLDKEEGFDYLFLFIEKLPNAEKETLHFLSVFLDKPIKEIEEIPITEMWNVISGVIQDPNFMVFFQQAAK